ncbi:hypothetical protein PMIN01_04718 [Paraphaeosphaeria minitans]|uniref:UBA domain-containing protein n=1 Tax=Paraphaeosphaeria minitans TaxID=565426 RepID=A0A9P6GMR0_9PLEO|nr:hypothetical protein PMIN01_04718 [Paraphaeosphaeria minitans]
MPPKKKRALPQDDSEETATAPAKKTKTKKTKTKTTAKVTKTSRAKKNDDDDGYNTQQKAAISQFMSFASTDQKTAIKHLKNAGWDPSAAVNA